MTSSFLLDNYVDLDNGSGNSICANNLQLGGYNSHISRPECVFEDHTQKRKTNDYCTVVIRPISLIRSRNNT